MMPEPIVTVTRPELTAEEREWRKQEARKALAAFFEAYHRKNKQQEEKTA